MNYYIIKPRAAKISEQLIEGIKESDRSARIVDTLDECDIAVLQKSWTRSKTAIAEYNRQRRRRHKPCEEGCIYTTRYTVHLNQNRDEKR